MQKWLVGLLLLPEILSQNNRVGAELAEFQSIFARSASDVRPSEKSLINTNRKSNTHFPVSPIWKSYVVPKPRKGAQNAVSKIWTISCDNTEAVRDRLSKILITNRKSHTDFPLVPTSITLNDLERRNGTNFAFFTEFGSVAGRLCHSDWR